MQYVYFYNESLVSVTNLLNGEVVQINSGQPQFEDAVELVKSGQYADVFTLTPKHIVQKMTVDVVSDDGVRIAIDTYGNGEIVINGMTYVLDNAIINRIIKMHEDGFNIEPMLNFVYNLYKNPSRTAVNELFLFIDSCELPITEDGHFIAYKIVRDDYMDIYSGTMSNKVGDVVSMPRNQVDDKRENTCSVGLHFCSREYLSSYGSNNKSTDRCLLLKINPADVVSIPSDYNNAKGRTWRYEVVGEVEGEWRTWLPNKDYTESSVVADSGEEIDSTELPDSNDEVEYEDWSWKSGYLDGYRDGKARVEFEPRDPLSQNITGSYDDGYDEGYKDGRGHKRKKVK